MLLETDLPPEEDVMYSVAEIEASLLRARTTVEEILHRV